MPNSGPSDARSLRFERLVAPWRDDLFRYTSHVHDLAGAIEEARAMGNLPPRLIVFGIEGRVRGTGSGLSDEVESAACRVQEMIVREIEKS